MTDQPMDLSWEQRVANLEGMLQNAAMSNEGLTQQLRQSEVARMNLESRLQSGGEASSSNFTSPRVEFDSGGLKLPMPEKFSGAYSLHDRAQKAHMFVVRCETYFACCKGATARWKISYAAGLLTEAAEKWYYALHSANSVPATWEEFKAAFLANYESIVDVQYMLADFRKCVQQSSVHAYNTAFNLLALQLHLNLGDAAFQPVIVGQYLSGLKQHVQEKVIGTDQGIPDTLEKAQLLALNVDALTGFRRSLTATEPSGKFKGHRQPSYKGAATAAAASAGEPMDLGAIELHDKLKGIKAKLSKEEWARRRKEKLCFNCTSKNHACAECRCQFKP